jgi:arsenate reductase
VVTISAGGEAAKTMKRVIFACVHSAGRSQMAAAFFNAMADPAKAVAMSAGTQPAERVHPEVVAVMREVGLDLSDAKPTRLTSELARGVSLLVTMGCGDECPVVPGARREDWPLPDPKGQPLGSVRGIRDEIRRKVAELADSEDCRP